MTRRIATTLAADEDIRIIATYIAIDNPKAARQFGEELWAAFGRIADYPEAGAVATGFSVPLRFVRVSPRFRRYLIFYRQPDESAIEIVRVLHAARDLARLFRDWS